MVSIIIVTTLPSSLSPKAGMIPIRRLVIVLESKMKNSVTKKTLN